MLSTTNKNSNNRYEVLRKRLLVEQRNLGKRIQRCLRDVSIETEPDDEAAQAIGSIARDISVATMERERETYAEIEEALRRIEKGDYGLCESCGAIISEARLRALPWARLCIDCANRSDSSSAEYLRLRTAS